LDFNVSGGYLEVRGMVKRRFSNLDHRDENKKGFSIEFHGVRKRVGNKD
jgi:hypothetical protein